MKKLPNILLFDSFFPPDTGTAALAPADCACTSLGSDGRRCRPASFRSMSTDVRAAEESLSSPLPAALDVSLCEVLGESEQSRKVRDQSRNRKRAANLSSPSVCPALGVQLP